MTQSTKDIRELIMQSSGLLEYMSSMTFFAPWPIVTPPFPLITVSVVSPWRHSKALTRIRRCLEVCCHQRLHYWQSRSKVVLQWCIFYWYIVQMITYKDVSRDPTQGDTPSPVTHWQESRYDWRVPPRFGAGYYPGNVIDIDHSQTHHLLTVTDIHHIETIKTLTP